MKQDRTAEFARRRFAKQWERRKTWPLVDLFAYSGMRIMAWQFPARPWKRAR